MNKTPILLDNLKNLGPCKWQETIFIDECFGAFKSENSVQRKLQEIYAVICYVVTKLDT